jgi:hypothetical protein
MNETQLIGTIKAHIAKGDKAKDKAEQHYIAAGQYLKQLKAAHDGSWDEWETLLKTKIGIGKSRASELMQIADGTKTAADVAAATTERSQKHRALSPLRNGENSADLGGKRLSEEAKTEILARLAGEEVLQTTLAQEFGVAASTISRILRKQALNPNINSYNSADVDDDIETAAPEEIKSNILDTIERQKAVAHAYKKVLAVSSFDQMAKEEISSAAGGLITTWQSLQRALAHAGGENETRTAALVENAPQHRTARLHPFRHLETGSVVWRYRGRAGYVPIDESEAGPPPSGDTTASAAAPVENAPPPDVSADNMKAQMAALDDGLDIPASLRR